MGVDRMMKILVVSGTFLFFFFCSGCTSLQYASTEKQKKVQQRLVKGIEDSNSKRALRQKKLFDALKERQEYEQVSYTKERIDKYFETTNNRQSLDELDETYKEIEKTKE